MENNMIPAPLKGDEFRFDSFKNGKVLLYHIGISSLLKYKEHSIDRLKNTISDIKAHKDKLNCIFAPSLNVRELERINLGLWKKYLEFEKTIEDEGQIFVDKSGDVLKYIDIVDGYYGDGGEVAHKCRNRGIPVMLRKAD